LPLASTGHFDEFASAGDIPATTAPLQMALCTSNAALTLPPGNAAVVLIVTGSSAGECTLLAPTGGSLYVDGSATPGTATITTRANIWLTSDGTNWHMSDDYV
jgi:hypothetical protein